MTLNYHKIWTAMNDLETSILRLQNVIEVMDTCAESIQSNNYRKAEVLAYASQEYLEMICKELDSKFQVAWQETVKKVNRDSMFESKSLIVDVDTFTGDYCVKIPEDMMSLIDLKYKDEVKWIHCKNQDQGLTLQKIHSQSE